MEAWQLADREWEELSPILQMANAHKKRGGSKTDDDRRMAEACLYRYFHAQSASYRTFGWHEMPKELGVPASSVNRQFRAWKKSGTWVKFWDALLRVRHGKPRLPRRKHRSAPSPVMRIQAELERAYGYFNSAFFGGNLPPDVVISVDLPRSARVAGYYCSRLWRGEDRQLGHLAVSAYILSHGVETVMEVLLHEMVHLRNDHVGIPDCNPRNQYHNQTFQDVAMLVGLECPKRDTNYGFASTRLTNRARRVIAKLRVDEAIFRWRVGGGGLVVG